MSETQPQLKYRGVPVFIAGRELIVPSLSVRQFSENMNLLMDPGISPQDLTAAFAASDHAAIAELRGKIEERMNKLVPVIGLAIRRNYPEITDEELFDMLDLDSFAEVLKVVQAASGMKQVKPGESQPVAAQ